MKKYRLIKWYPSLPEKWKNTEVIMLESLSMYCQLNATAGKGFSKEEIESNPEFWKKVIEKDYELSDWVSDDGTEYKDGQAVWNRFVEKDHKTTILKVKRLSDNIEFKVGERAKTVTSRGNHIIESFSIKQKVTNKNEDGSWNYDGVDRIWVTWDNDTGGNWLDKIEHYKPLFKSVDGEDIYKWDVFYVVDNRFFNIQETHGGNFQNDKWKEQRFANKENAIEYVVQNKPCLSFKDIHDKCQNSDKEDFGILRITVSQLKKLIKSKL